MMKPFTDRRSQRSFVVWTALVVATLITWRVGTDHGMDYRFSTVVVLGVAFVKVSLVGMNFMELRAAPLLLRVTFNCICVVMCTALVAMYLTTS